MSEIDSIPNKVSVARYNRDREFRALVDAIVESRFAAYDVREAAKMAMHVKAWKNLNNTLETPKAR